MELGPTGAGLPSRGLAALGDWCEKQPLHQRGVSVRFNIAEKSFHLEFEEGSICHNGLWSGIRSNKPY